MGAPFRVTFAPGVIPDKWLRTWTDRMPDAPLEAVAADPADQLTALHDGACDIAFVRLPIDRDGLHVIPLYREVPVVVVAKDHPVAAFDEIDVTELAGEHVLHHADEAPQWSGAMGGSTTADIAERPPTAELPDQEPLTVAQAIEVAASGAGVVLAPMSLARLHHRKDVVHRPVTGLDETPVGIAWRVDNEDPRIETFIGIVRGRTERSSRGGSATTDDRSDAAPATSAKGKGNGSAPAKGNGSGKGKGSTPAKGKGSGSGSGKQPPSRTARPRGAQSRTPRRRKSR